MPAVRVLLAGGGTAGHVEPALATADALRAVCQQTGIDCEITVLGTAEGLEATLVPARGYRLATVPKVVMPRRIATDLFTVLPRLRSARDRAEQILRERDIDVVVGFGGYASAPAYHRGEIVVFDHPEPPHKQVIHRIVDVTDRGFVTRGDNRPTTDGTVAPEHVHGTLALRVPRLGYAIVVLQGALHVLFGTIGGWCMLAGLALGVAAWRFAQSEL